ncbi:methyltransferase domain-containing protein [Collimonas pratensis]|uniref:class I SAM-dependent methyltransferase n=1 Tax=Collimonas pratensis TaxID=279113 RepID=UPI00143E07A9|nr:class I SAM-dependent methyltransferase [Collimonas pratensis]NKI70556.1 methyltransferase domain-containing protein [Collimonas pratensis]
MRKLLKKIFGTGKEAEVVELAPAPAAVAAQPPAVVPVDPFHLGLSDALASGWYLQDSDELYRGFQISADDVVLDVGCGDGGNALFCANRGAHVIVADIDPVKVDATKQRLADSSARVVQGLVSDVNPLPLVDGVASKVISMEVLEHVDDPAQFLRELVRVGRSGAQYLLTVPDPVQEQLQKEVAPAAYFQKPNHIRIIQRDEFEKMVTDAGLVIEDHSYYGFYWSIWWLFFWVCKVDHSNAHHPLLDSWTKTWEILMQSPNGEQVRKTLNDFMPKSQVIIAHKP